MQRSRRSPRCWRSKVTSSSSRPPRHGAPRYVVRHGAPRYVEVWVRTAQVDCEARDVKGLYARARAGNAPAFPGVGVAYEPPRAPDVIAAGCFDDHALEQFVALLGGSSPVG